MGLKGLLLFSLLFYCADLGCNASRLHSNIYKSIKSQDGDVIDCMDISKQPAFDHPKLKHHAIKMMPSYHPEGEAALKRLYRLKRSNHSTISQLWQRSGHCPESTIPVRRTQKPVNSTVKKSHPGGRRFSSNSTTRTQDTGVSYSHEYVVRYANGGYYGAKATISAWRPYVEGSYEFSLSQLWLVGGSDSDLNTIEAGLTVNPLQFGDSKNRLFVFWTADNYGSTGCWNLRCSGFVQITNKVAIGASVYSARGYHPEITFIVWKDKSQGVWWLQCNDEVVGYWPADIYTTLNVGSASSVEWGGEIINSHANGRHTATQMGSGEFAQGGGGKASYFKNLEVVDGSNYLQLPASVGTIVTDPTCYNIASGKSSGAGYYFYYGGPGRNPNCP